MSDKNERPLNEKFIELVTQQGVTMYDQHGTPVHHTKDLALVADYLNSTGERHNGPGLSGIRPEVK